MSVIEDALRRAELQGRSTPPRSVAQPTGAAAAVVHRPVLTPFTGAAAHHAPPSANPRRIETTPATPTSANARKNKPGVVRMPRTRSVGTLLIAAILSLVFGQLFLEALIEYPSQPAIIVAGHLGATIDGGTPHPIEIEPYAPELSAALVSADAPVDPAANPTVNRPVPIDATHPPPPAPVADRASLSTGSPIDPVEQSVANAALIESINQRFHVAGVMVSAGKRLAVVNDVVVGLGDRVDGAIIQAIDGRGAVIEVDGKKHHLNVSARGRNKDGPTNSSQ